MSQTQGGSPTIQIQTCVIWQVPFHGLTNDDIKPLVWLIFYITQCIVDYVQLNEESELPQTSDCYKEGH